MYVCVFVTNTTRQSFSAERNFRHFRLHQALQLIAVTATTTATATETAPETATETSTVFRFSVSYDQDNIFKHFDAYHNSLFIKIIHQSLLNCFLFSHEEDNHLKHHSSFIHCNFHLFLPWEGITFSYHVFLNYYYCGTIWTIYNLFAALINISITINNLIV